jgi:hypothetical protein
MAADPISLERLAEIPDPAVVSASAPIPPPRTPAEPSLTRADRRRRSVAAVVFGVAWAVAVTITVGLRPDIGSPGVIAPAIAWLLGGGVVLVMVLRPGARGLPAGVGLVRHALWVVPALYALVALIVAGPELPRGCSPGGCVLFAVAVSMGALAALAFVLRGTFLSAPGWRGAAVGALAGLAGSVGAHAHCPVQCLDHIVEAHGASIVLFAAAGAVLGRIGGRP